MSEKPFLKRLLQATLIIAVSMCLIRLAICLFLQVWWVLAIIAALAILAIFGYRLWRNKHW